MPRARGAAPPQPGSPPSWPECKLRTPMRCALALALVSIALGEEARAEIPGAQLVLEVQSPGSPGRYPEAAPPRFVLLEKGQFFVGGSRQIAAGRLEPAELKAMEARVARIRKLQGLGSQ